MSSVARAVESGATTIRGIIDATGLSRLKVERALQALEKQKLLIRDGQGFRAPAVPATPQVRECGSCSRCCTLLDGDSQYIVHREIRPSMEEAEIETIIQRARERFPGDHPRIISDNGPRFVARAPLRRPRSSAIFRVS